ncbi:polysaccharide biosynthesis tyrosine autokinase [bacterium]|nr:polysaccharide biosynthesis tyrosine autokinase [bacterium]
MEDFFEEQQAEQGGVDLKRYISALVKGWWFIGLVTILVSVPWLIYVKKQPPLYETTALITFDNVKNISSTKIDNRILRLKSRRFAEEVTADLGLTLKMEKSDHLAPLKRHEVFSHFSTTRRPVPGDYKLIFYPSGYCSFYYNGVRLDSLHASSFIQDTVFYNGLRFSLKEDIVGRRSVIHFYINPFQSTVNNLRSREKIINSRSGNVMKIILRDTNPVLVSQTVNRLANIFVEKSMAMNREESTLISSHLKKELKVAKAELNKSDYTLKRFRIQHPISLTKQNENTVSTLNDLAVKIKQNNLAKRELEMLLQKLDPNVTDITTGVSARYVYRQIPQLPVFQNDPAMSMINQQLLDSDRARGELIKNGAPVQNPYVIEISGRISNLENRIYELAEKKVKDLDRQNKEMNANIQKLKSLLESLPAEEIELIKLTRERNTNEELYNMVYKRYKEAQISAVSVSEQVSVLDPAVPPTAPITGSKKLKAIIGVLLGFFLGIGIVLTKEILDKSIKYPEDVKRYLNLSILGVIPTVKFKDFQLPDDEKAKSISSQIVTHDYSPTPVGEAYRSLRTSLFYSKKFGRIKSLVIGSAAPGEGKSFTAANLAITTAQQKSKTLLIDADLRRGVLHNTFDCSKKPGLTNYLTGIATLSNVMHETYIPNLSLITCGTLIPNPSELLGSQQMKDFIEEVSKDFDFIIFDTPPLMAATDAVIIGTLVDGVAVLIRSGMTNKENIKRKLELFETVETTIVGAILNCAGVDVAHEGYSYYRY